MDMHPIGSLAYFLDKGRAVIFLLGGVGYCDWYSDPEHVIELLDEYINVRRGEL